jgi:Holliday junction DNA helicase RuvA
MIYSVKGVITHIEQNLAVVEANNIGFACRTTANTLSNLKTGAEAQLFTYLHVREDAVELFGFAGHDELRSFKLLISVSGVGPKAALSILSELTPQNLVLCVAGGDSKSLTRAQGIGAKIAQRVVLELKDKIDINDSFNVEDVAGSAARAMPAPTEAIAALNALGFTTSQAAKALEGADRSLPTSELVKLALKKIGS